MNTSNEPGLLDEIHGDDVTYWFARGHSKCQHHIGPLHISCRNFISGKPKRYCQFVPFELSSINE